MVSRLGGQQTRRRSCLLETPDLVPQPLDDAIEPEVLADLPEQLDFVGGFIHLRLLEPCPVALRLPLCSFVAPLARQRGRLAV